MNMYSYDGPVMEFDNCVANRWIASTRAVSEKKARSNLTYQFKKKNNRLPGYQKEKNPYRSSFLFYHACFSL